MSLIAECRRPFRFRTGSTELGSLVARLTLALSALATPALGVEPVKAGPEVIVATEYADEVPRVASDPSGNFMVVWEEDAEVRGRRWLANGTELFSEVRLTGDNQELASGGSTSTGNVGVAADALGNFLVVYTATDGTSRRHRRRSRRRARIARSSSTCRPVPGTAR